MKNFNHLIITLLFIFFSYIVNANEIFDIKINGSEYVDKEIILSLIKNKDDLSDDELVNLISKKLFNTGNFRNIDIKIISNTILIDLEENYTIDNINFFNNERFKKNEILDIYNQIVETNTFNELLIEKFIDNISKLYMSFGYNQIFINYKITELKDINSVNIDFFFNEGKISKIGKVNFFGNLNYSKSDLLNQISSKPKRDLLFFISRNYKLDLVKNDIIKLKSFYVDSGYKDIKINFKTEYIEDKNKFNINFFIDEGIKYKFKKIDLFINTNFYTNEQKDYLNEILNDYKLKNLSNNIYNYTHTEIIKEILSDYIFSIGKNFFEIKVLEKIENDNVNILFEIKDANPKYVNLINIYGNDRTLDKVIRREISFVEGDPINDQLISESLKNIKRLGFFNNVKIDEEYIDDNLVDISILIDEQTSGDFNIGIAFGSIEGATFVSELNQNNIAGTGRGVGVGINTSDNNKSIFFKIKEPRVYKNIDFSYGLSYKESDFSKSSYYTLDKFDINIGIDFQITNKIRDSLSIIYELNEYSITNDAKVSSNILNSSGGNALIKLQNNISHNTINSFMRPNKGHFYKLSTLFSPITNDSDGYLQNIITLKKYISYRKNIISINSQIGNISSLQNDIITDSDKFSLGGYSLRGFDSRGVGPRNSSSSYVGGNSLFVTRLEFIKPLIPNSDSPLDIFVFTDFGSVFGNKTDPSNAVESIRSSAGYGIKFYSPIGPIGLSWGHALSSETYDKKREFLFSIGNLN